MRPRRPGRVRVIAGEVRGRRLVVPPRVRPTSDRVREAVFAALGPDAVLGASVLELYAGSGALAIEALSRGASRALLVDRDRAAVEACRRNLGATGFDERARVQASPVRALLGSTPPVEAPFDLVLVDPPYDASAEELSSTLASLSGPGWVADDGLVVVEAPRRDAPAWPVAWAVRWERRYGDTLVAALSGARDRPGGAG